MHFFACETPSEITLGTEYKRFLQATFDTLTDADERAYVAKSIERFLEEEWQWSGRDLLSSQLDSLRPKNGRWQKLPSELLKTITRQSRRLARLAPDFVQPQAPPNTEEDWKKPVREIVNRLTTDWVPSALKEKYKKNEDFLRPIECRRCRDKVESGNEVSSCQFIQRTAVFRS